MDHLDNVLRIFLSGLADTIKELDHVEKREDITARNFVGRLRIILNEFEPEAQRYGVPIETVLSFLDDLETAVLATQDHPPTGRAILQLVSSRPELEDDQD